MKCSHCPREKGTSKPGRCRECAQAYKKEYQARYYAAIKDGKQIPSMDRVKRAAGVQRRKEVRSGLRYPERCDVCGNKPVKRRLCLDHNHTTGKYRGWNRGWICNDCNLTLGTAGDNPRLLLALAGYLEARGCYPTRPLIR